ncbi:MAG: hypothetical protein HRT67_09835 [Flavobacteriaceae bacterium]|nr:hypothetical protein [Flavobacteriaceae bacterium]
MRISEFTHLLHNPQEITDQQVLDINSVITEFPYFQSARALYLKALKNKESFKYNLQLKKTAAYTTDRSVLFEYITSPFFLQNKISEQIKSNSAHLMGLEINDFEDISIYKNVILDDSLNQHLKDSAPTLDPFLFKEKKKTPTSEAQKKPSDSLPKQQTPEAQLQIGTPLEFNTHEKHSFTQWLQLTSYKPIVRTDENQPEKQTSSSEDTLLKISKKEANKRSKFDLIDKFIQANPKITPTKKEAPIHNIANLQSSQSETLMTETLARIYLEQKNYDKAIQAYNILSLKYPEKSSLFADQIQAVKELKKQNK